MAVNTSPFFFFLYGFTGCTKGFTCPVTPAGWGGSDPLPGTEGTAGTGGSPRLAASDGHFGGHGIIFRASRPCLAVAHWVPIAMETGLAWQQAGASAPAAASPPPPDWRSQTGCRVRSPTVQAARGCAHRVSRALHTPPWEVNKANVLKWGGGTPQALSPGIVSCVPRSLPRNSPVVAPRLALKAQLSQRAPPSAPGREEGLCAAWGRVAG